MRCTPADAPHVHASVAYAPHRPCFCHSARACEQRKLPPDHAGWMLAEELIPGKKRRKMSATVTSFLCDVDLPRDAPPPDSLAQV